MHKHSCDCKHENIKLCKTCKVPYCVDCGHEWFEKCTLNHEYVSIPSVTTTSPPGPGVWYLSPEIPCDMTPTITCGHTSESPQ